MLANRFRILWVSLLSILFLVTLVGACRPAGPEMISVTEVVQLGEEQFIITRIVELVDTPTPTTTPPPVEPQPVEIDLGYEEDLPNLDPQLTSGKAGLDMAENLFAGLTNFNHSTMQIEPELASSWRVSGDGRTWTFDLRDDVYWLQPPAGPLDGDQTGQIERLRPVDADDVVYAIHRACQSASAVPDAFVLFIIEGCEAVYSVPEVTERDLELIGARAVDEFTLEVRLNAPASYFLTIAALPQMRPLPQDLIEEEGDSWLNLAGELDTGWQTPEKLITSGPFVPLVSQLDLSQAVLLRNPHWPITTTGNAAVVRLGFGKASEDLFASWQDKDLDLTLLPATERATFLEQSPDKARLLTNQVMFYVGYNFSSPVFQEAAVRRAFSAALDREQLVADMFDGRGLGMRHFTPPGVIGAPPAGEVGVGYSPDFALRQMDQSNVRSCRLLPPITFLVSTADLSLLQAELIRDMWTAELGCDEVTIGIEQVDFGDLLGRTAPQSDRRPDMWELAWPPHYPDAHAVLSDLFHCEEGENRQQRPCEDADRWLRQARIEPQAEERATLYRQVENAFFGEDGSFPAIPLYVRGDYLLVQNWLVDYQPALSGGEQFDTILINEELKRLERERAGS